MHKTDIKVRVKGGTQEKKLLNTIDSKFDALNMKLKEHAFIY